jgi:8-oxo-dGTP pyrophosphatase MutT (NUDIX family)
VADPEFSAGGVVVRGDEVVVIVPVRRDANGNRVLALPKGHPNRGESAEQAAAREVAEETGITAELIGELGETRYSYERRGRRVAKRVAFYLFRYLSGDVEDHDHEIEEARWIRLEEAAQSLTYAARAVAIGIRPVGWRAVRVLNFYSSVFADQLRRGRKTATIRLGDKSHKYRKNDCVLVTIGYQHSPREKIFNAVIDQVEVKRVKDLSPRDIEHDNPEFRRVDEMVHFLEQIYGRNVGMDDTVTVVRFSQIIENPPELRDRIHGLGGAQN